MVAKRGKILTFANPKGGVGKSTICCLVTAMLKWSNKYDTVQLIDADKQGAIPPAVKKAIFIVISLSYYFNSKVIKLR